MAGARVDAAGFAGATGATELEQPCKSRDLRSSASPEPPTGVAFGSPRGDNRAVTTSATRVVLADDDLLLREGLAGLLERSGFEVVGQCGDASELLALVREHRPEL